MNAYPFASDAKVQETVAALGTSNIATTQQALLQQILVAAATNTGGESGATNSLLLAGATASDLAGLTAATAATGGLLYGTQGGADRKFTMTAAGATLAEAADAAAQRTALSAAGLVANTFTGAQTLSVNGAASAPAMHLTGVPFAGTGTTSFPQLYVNDSAATASTTLNTAGTMFGVNANGTQDLVNLMTDGASRFKVASTGKITILPQSYPSPSISPTANANYGIGFNSTILNFIANNEEAGAASYGNVGSVNRPFMAAAGFLISGYSSAPSGSGYSTGIFLASLNSYELTLGYTQATTPNNQTLKAHNVTTGTGAALTVAGGTGTSAVGAAVTLNGGISTTAGGSIELKTASTTSLATRMTIKASGVINVTGIPTSASGLSAGDVWSNLGILTVV